MGEAYFYHLTRGPLQNTLPVLLERSLAQGWRVELRGTETGRMDQLDQDLWRGPVDGFLAHGLANGTEQDALQPILLTVPGLGSDPQRDDSRECLMAIEGADVTADEVRAKQRVCILFDGNDGEALERARGQWRDLTGAGCAAQYWSEDSGKWQKKAQSDAKAQEPKSET